jgi:hypothetical protein
VPLIVAWILVWLAQNVETLYVGRLLAGMGGGKYYTVFNFEYVIKTYKAIEFVSYIYIYIYTVHTKSSSLTEQDKLFL